MAERIELLVGGFAVLATVVAVRLLLDVRLRRHPPDVGAGRGRTGPPDRQRCARSVGGRGCAASSRWRPRWRFPRRSPSATSSR
ncbi:hypothetical protein AB5I41_25115 [Sphingomonas sp. MMS24-JH45]